MPGSLLENVRFFLQNLWYLLGMPIQVSWQKIVFIRKSEDAETKWVSV